MMPLRATSLGHAGLLIETEYGSVVCDPWFLPAFFGSWFVFPRNDRLSADLMARVEHADYLYISHIHADHLDEPWLIDHISRDVTVLIPGFPTRELERRIRALGFSKIIRTTPGQEINLNGLRIAIHVETSITDGPGGDSAIVVSDGVARVVNQNDCRPNETDALAIHGPIDLHWLQFSGAIWYPMVYDETPERMRELVDAKVDSQFRRALHYVDALGARAVVPSAGPPCFLDPELFSLNVIDGDELSIFPDQRPFLAKLQERGVHGILTIPGTEIEVGVDSLKISQPCSDDRVARIFSHKREYLQDYQADWAPWLEEHKATWADHTTNLFATIKAWWEPLLAMAPTLCAAVGGNCLIRADDIEILIDFAAGQVRKFAGETYAFRFDIPRRLVETVVAQRAVDWSNALFLSCRFRAWREGAFNEYLYSFFKSQSVERMRRTESEARHKLDPSPVSEEIELGGYIMQRACPHRQADLGVFGEIEGDQLVCTLHGWRFDLATGKCLTADDRGLRVRRAD